MSRLLVPAEQMKSENEEIKKEKEERADYVIKTESCDEEKNDEVGAAVKEEQLEQVHGNSCSPPDSSLSDDTNSVKAVIGIKEEFVEDGPCNQPASCDQLDSDKLRCVIYYITITLDKFYFFKY